MEQLLVFRVSAAPDRALSHVARRLAERGFRVRDGRVYDLVARRGAHRAFVGIGAHKEGLAARIKTKALWPGGTAQVHQELVETVAEALGAPVRRNALPHEGAR